MSKNKLYNFIAGSDYSKPVLPEGVQLIDKSDAANSLYLYNLPLPNPGKVGAYTLYHHLTVNRLLDNANGFPASEFHYTALLTDSNKVNYKLHVFYNHKNEMLGLPVLRQEQEDDYITVDSSKQHQLFLYLANVYAQPLIQSLLNARQQQIAALANQYDLLEKEAEDLSQNALDNKSLLSEKIRQQIQTLEQLVAIAPGNNKYSSILSFLKKYAINPDFFPGNELFLDVHDEPESDQSLSTAKSEPDTDKKEQKPKRKSDNRSETQERFKVADELKLIHEQLTHLKNSINTSELEEKLSSLEQINSKILSLKDRLTFDDLRMTSQELKSFRNAEKQLGELASKNLLTLLLKSQFDQAKRLKDFYPLLSEQLLGMCLSANNHGLLTFLIENQIFSVHHRPLLVNNESYSSMLDYCFRASAPNKNKLEVANVLITHGAFLLTCEHPHVLPYAALLLTQENHPLAGILRTHTRSMDDVAAFYKELKEMLVLIAQRKDLKDEHIAAANNAISIIDKHREEIRSGERIFGKKGGLFFQSTPRTRIEDQRIDDDPEVKTKAAIMRYNLERLASLTDSKQLDLLRETIMRKTQNLAGDSSMSFEEAKANAISHYDRLNSDMAKLMEYYEIHRQLNLPLKTFKPRERKRMIEDMTRLGHEVKRIYGEYCDFEDHLFKPGKNKPDVATLTFDSSGLSLFAILEQMGIHISRSNPDDETDVIELEALEQENNLQP